METIYIDKSKGWTNILKIIIPYCLVVGVCQIIGFYFAGLDISNYSIIHDSTKQSFIIMFFGLLGTLLIVWIFRKYVDKKTISSLGLKKGFIMKDILLGIIFGFLLMLLGFICLILTKQIIFQNFQLNPIDLILSIGLFMFVAISEELFFRGYVLNNLMTSFNKYIAVIISSIVFCLMHVLNPGFNILALGVLFITGILFGLAYNYTKNLWFPFALHFSWNFFQGTIFGFNVSGQNTYSLIVTKFNSPNIWNGGIFGFEGSLLAIVFQVFAIAIVFIIFKKRLTTQISIDENKKGSS